VGIRRGLRQWQSTIDRAVAGGIQLLPPCHSVLRTQTPFWAFPLGLVLTCGSCIIELDAPEASKAVERLFRYRCRMSTEGKT
jgi:hypothetical protein